MNLVNIVDKDIALQLNALGFKSRQQFVSKQEIFTFIESPDLLKFLNENFSNQDFFISQAMNF